MAASDGRGPPGPGDTRENPTGVTNPSTSLRDDTAEVSVPARKPPPPPRRTGAIPIVGERRKSTTSIPIVETDIVEQAPRRTGQIPIQSAQPRQAAQQAVPASVREDTAPNALPVERPVARSAVPRRPSHTLMPAQGGTPIGRRSTGQMIPAVQPAAPEKPSLLNEDTNPRLEMPTAPAPVSGYSREATDAAIPALDEQTDPTDPARHPRTTIAPPAQFGATEVRPSLDPDQLAAPDVPWADAPRSQTAPQLSAKPTPRTTSREVPWEEVKDMPTQVGALPGRPPQKSDATATAPLPRLERPAHPTDPHDDPEPTIAIPGLAGEAAAAQIRKELAAAKQAEAPAQGPPALPGSRSSELSDKPQPKRRGTYSLLQAQGGAGERPEQAKSTPALHELSRVIRLEAVKNAAGRMHGFQIAIGVVMLVLGGGAFLAFFLGHHDRPPLEALQVAYPYGFSGGTLPNGRTAPPVSQVLFDYKATVDCGEDVCARYLVHTADNSFQLTMDLRKEGPDWKLAGDAPVGAQGMVR